MPHMYMQVQAGDTIHIPANGPTLFHSLVVVEIQYIHAPAKGREKKTGVVRDPSFRIEKKSPLQMFYDKDALYKKTQQGTFNRWNC